MLRGDPQLVGQVADALEFKHRHSSVVIAWVPEDKPTPQQISDVLDSFEQLAWAGLAPDRYAWSAVRHDDTGGGVHVHILTARVDLETGKSLNIAPPGWEYTFGNWRNYHNLVNNWARPDDPARARVLQPGHQALIDADRRKGPRVAAKSAPHEAINGSVKNPEEAINGSPKDPTKKITGSLSAQKEAITKFLTERIELGLITNREDVLASPKEYGEVSHPSPPNGSGCLGRMGRLSSTAFAPA